MPLVTNTTKQKIFMMGTMIWCIMMKPSAEAFAITTTMFSCRSRSALVVARLKGGGRSGNADTAERVAALEAKEQFVLENLSGVEDKVDKLEGEMNKKLEKLEAKIDKNFEKVDKNFEKLEAKVDKNFEKVDKNFEKVDKKFDKVEGQFKELEAKMDTNTRVLIVLTTVVLGSFGTDKLWPVLKDVWEKLL